MAKISGTTGPSSADVAKELPLLIQTGKIHPVTNKPHEWIIWKVG